MKGSLRSGKSKSRSSHRFVYRERDASQVKARASSKNPYADVFKSVVRVWRPSEGPHSIRFLPPTWDNPEHYGFDVYLHRFVGPRQATVLCPSRMFNKPCPICEAAEAAEREGEVEDAKNLRSSRQVAAYIIDRDKKGRPEVELWLMPWTVDQDIAKICYSNKTGEVIYLDHPEIGYDVNFDREGTRINTRYRGFTVDRRPSAISDDPKEYDELLDLVTENPIPSILIAQKYDVLKSLIDGTSEEGEDEDDVYNEDTDLEKSRKKSASKKRASYEDEDDEEDESPFEDDDDEPRHSSKKSRTLEKRRSYEDDDTDEDDDDEPDEDDEDDDDERRRPSERKSSGKDSVKRERRSY